MTFQNTPASTPCPYYSCWWGWGVMEGKEGGGAPSCSVLPTGRKGVGLLPHCHSRRGGCPLPVPPAPWRDVQTWLKALPLFVMHKNGQFLICDKLVWVKYLIISVVAQEAAQFLIITIIYFQREYAEPFQVQRVLPNSVQKPPREI